jgi:hypothetical protein
LRRLAPWAGWICGIGGWFVAHQFGSDFVQWQCSRAAPAIMILVGIAGAVIVIAGGLISLGQWRRTKVDADARSFIAGTGTLAAGIFLIALVFQTMSTPIIPRCFG